MNKEVLTISGANTVALTVVQMPSHNHGGIVSSGGSHSHNIYGWNGSANAPVNRIKVDVADDKINASVASTSSAGSHSHTISSNGGGQPHENRPAYYTLAFIMKL